MLRRWLTIVAVAFVASVASAFVPSVPGRHFCDGFTTLSVASKDSDTSDRRSWAGEAKQFAVALALTTALVLNPSPSFADGKSRNAP